MGRPSKRTPEIEAEIITILKLGYGIETVADRVGLNASTIHDWKRKDPEFSKTVRKAVADGKIYVGGLLMKKIKDKHLGAICFWLKCRGGREWREYTPGNRRVKFKVGKTRTVQECVEAQSRVTEAAGNGEITLDEMEKFGKSIERNLKALMEADITEQLEELKEMIAKQD